MKIILTTIETGIDINKGGPTGVIKKIMYIKRTNENNMQYVSLFSIKNSGSIAAHSSLETINEASWFSRIIMCLRKAPLYKYIFLCVICFKYRNNFLNLLKQNKDNRYEDDKREVFIHSHDILSAYFTVKHAFNQNNYRYLVSLHSVGAYNKQLNFNIFFTLIIKYCERFVLLNACSITFPSRGALNLYLQDFKREEKVIQKLNSDSVRIVYNGIDTEYIDAVDSKNIQAELRKELNINDNKDFVVLTVANHVNSKGVDLLPLVAKEFGANIKFFVVGEGELKAGLILAIKEQKIKNIYLLPKLSREKLINLIKISNIFLMPSRYTVFDLVMLEAMYVGGPVMLASNISGHDEMITDGYDGILCEHNQFAKK